MVMSAPTETEDRDPIESFGMTAAEVLTPKAKTRKVRATLHKEDDSEEDSVVGNGMECECHVLVRLACPCLSVYGIHQLVPRLKMKLSFVKEDAGGGIMSGQSSNPIALVSLPII